MKYVECPRCGEITLEIKKDGSAECECGYQESPPWSRPDFNDWLHTVDLDVIDGMGKVEAMRIAYYAGISAQQDMEIARLSKQLDDLIPDDISLLKRQAE